MLIKNIKNEKGFTLIEIILVIAILGTLMLLAIPSLKDLVKTTAESEKQSHTAIVNTASKQYEAEYGELAAQYDQLADAQMTSFNTNKYNYEYDKDTGVISVNGKATDGITE